MTEETGPYEWEKIEWLEKILKGKGNNLGIEKVKEVKWSPATAKGDNYTSDMLRANVTAQLAAGETLTTSVIYKKKLVTGDASTLLDTIYAREATIYNCVLEKYYDITRGTSIDGNPMWPWCYSATTDGIVMEDIKASGYTILNRRLGLDLKHSLLVMKCLGRLHAISVAALKKGLVDPKILGKLGYLEESSTTYLIMTLTSLGLAIKQTWGPEWASASEKVMDLSKKFQSKMAELYDVEPPLKVITHGDIWVSNMMFKYDEQGNPDHIKFVDFQVAQYGSFAWDINFFMYMSLTTEVREPNYEVLLSQYVNSLRETIKILGVDESLVPSLQTVKDECYRLRLYTFYTEAVEAPIVICDPEEVVSLEDLVSDPTKAVPIFSNPKYTSYMKPAMKNYIAEGTI